MSHREPALIPALLALLGACTVDAEADSSPQLEQVRFGDAQTLRLVFSEAVVVGNADPTAFRLSLGVKDEESTVYYALDYDGLAYDTDGPASGGDPSAASASAGNDTGYGTTYADPTAEDGYDSGYDPSADGGYDDEGYAMPGPSDSFRRPIPHLAIDDLGITAIRAVDETSSEVELELAGSIADTPACEALAEFVADGSKAGIFLHHRSASRTIEDGAGNRLAPIAAHWVDASAKAYVEVMGDFPELRPYLPIPCP